MADEDDDISDKIVEHLERDRVRTAELAEKIGEVTKREALIVQALFDPPDDNSIAVAVADIDAPAHVNNEWDAFRELFPHKLEGAEDELLEQVRAVVRLTTEAVEAGDVEGLRIVASLLNPLLGFATKDDRRRAILALVETWISELPQAVETIPWARSRMPLATAFRLAAAGMSVPLAVQAKMIPEILANISKPGRSPWGASEVTVRLMRACGYDDGASEDTLRSRLAEARKSKKSKKSTAKNS